MAVKYPSEYLEDLVPVVDKLEDDLLDRYSYARAWLSGFKVWNWTDQARRIDDLKSKNSMLVRELRSLQDAYRRETGKAPPGNLVLVLADHEGVSNAMAAFRRAVSNMATRRSG